MKTKDFILEDFQIEMSGNGISGNGVSLIDYDLERFLNPIATEMGGNGF